MPHFSLLQRLPTTVMLAFALAAPGSAPAAPLHKASSIPTPPGWTLTFDDEFNGPFLDTTKWTATDWASTINNEQQDYAPDDVSLHDGALRLTTRKRARDGREYTSGEVRSAGKFSQLYGRFEFRARLPATQGTWSAEYLVAENDHWPPEIDVEEFLGKAPHVLHMTTHWATLTGYHGVYHTERDDTDVDYSQWHVYAVEWDPGHIRWYIDGHLYGSSGPEARPYISHVPMYLRINTALGGWAGGADGSSIFPQIHDIDWVRVYRRTGSAPPVNAGPDLELASPEMAAQLAGISCSPMGPHKATWSQISGAGQATFAQPHALATAARFSEPGTYRLRLSVADGSVSADSDLTVRVDKPQEDSVPASADAYTFVNSEYPGLHADGGGQDLEIGTRLSLQNTHDQMQSYLTFDLSHAPRATHAVLRLYGGQVYTSYPAPLACLVQPVVSPKWDEKSALWTDVPVLGTQPSAFTVLAFAHNSTEHWYEIDVTSAVQTAQAANQTLAGFAVLTAASGGRVSAAFHSREDPAHAPHLILTP